MGGIYRIGNCDRFGIIHVDELYQVKGKEGSMTDQPHRLEIKPYTTNDAINYQEGSVVSREIIKTPHTTVTLFAFAKDQGLSEHTTPFTAFVQVIDGTAEITIGDKQHTVKAGEMIVMPASTPHALQAKEAFKMVLTMAR
jgi:quercetin dioxygenase-like cupin family protein